MSLIFKQSTAQVVTVILSSGGTPVTGLGAADIDAYVSKNGGTPAVYNLTGNVTELSAANMPGLYAVDFDAGVTNTVGELVILLKDTTVSGVFDQYAIRATIFAILFNELDASITTSEGNVTSALSTTETNLTVEIDQNEAKIDTVNTNVSGFTADIDAIKGPGYDENFHSLKVQSDKFDTRVPGEVAQKTQLVGTGGTESAPAGVGLWDVLGDGSVTLGDVDISLRRLLGLTHENFAIRNQSYDTQNNLLNATVKIYPSKADTEGDTNEIGTYTITASYDSSNRLTDYTMVKEP